MPANPLIEQELGVAVNIEWTFKVRFSPEGVRPAVSGSRRGVQEPGPVNLTSHEERLRDFKIVGHHVTAIGLHGVAASAFVKNAVDRTIVAIGKAQVKLCMINVVGNLQIGQIAELVAVAQVIDRHDVGDATLIQTLDDVAADETGGSGHHDGHALLLFCAGFMRQALAN